MGWLQALQHAGALLRLRLLEALQPLPAQLALRLPFLRGLEQGRRQAP